VPRDQPHTHDAQGHSFQWKLVLEDHISGEPWAFELTMLPESGFDAAPHSSTFESFSAEHIQLPTRVVQLEQGTHGWYARFAAPGFNAWMFMLMALAGGFGLFAWFNRVSMGAVLLLACTASALALLLALHHSTRRQVLHLAPGWLVHQRASLLYKSVQRVKLDQVQSFLHELAYSQSSGANKLHYYHVRAALHGAAHQTVSPAVAMQGVAAALTQRLNTALQATPRITMGEAPRLDDPYRLARPLTWSALLLAAGLSVIAVQHAWRAEQQQAKLDALWSAQDASDLTKLAALLDAGHDPNTVAPSGSTLLMLAAARGQLAHVDLLLARDADVNAVNRIGKTTRGDTALLVALYGGHQHVFERLLAAGARLDVKNMWDWTPMHMAALGNCVPCLQTLAARGLPLGQHADASRGETPLQAAAGKGSIDAMRWLIEQGQDPRATDPHGHDAMGWAKFFKRDAAARWLIDHGYGPAAR
jgi:ankyrin repeat protein